MNTTATTITFFRTAKGSKRHASWYCANRRRAITSGNPIALEAGEAREWAPCKACCPADLVAAERAEEQAREAAKRDALCDNAGVTHPKRIRSACKSCGKVGTVVRSTGSLKAHKPQR